jgi:hypothetical protein
MVEFHQTEDGGAPFRTVPWRNLLWVGVLAGLAMAALTILYAYGALAS